MLWFDVKLKRYSAKCRFVRFSSRLWFDVKLKRYSASLADRKGNTWLWFDVKLKRSVTDSDLEGFQNLQGLGHLAIYPGIDKPPFSGGP